MEKNDVKKLVMTVDVLMLKREVTPEGKEVKTIKMETLNEDVNEYLEVGSAEKVKELIKEKIKASKVFGLYDVNQLWYKWDDFLDMWRKKRANLMKAKRKDNEVDEIEELFEEDDFDIKKELTGDMKDEFLKMWKKKKSELKKSKKAAKKKDDVAD